MNAKNDPIGIFDSGVGGLTVLNECLKRLPQEHFIYISDYRFAPYGNRDEQYILSRVEACIKQLTCLHCKAIVAACNTATNVGIERVRQKYGGMFFGVEPALKPARVAVGDGQVLVLCTEATCKQAKFKTLYDKWSTKNTVLLPQAKLATLVENNIENIACLRQEMERIFAPYPNAKAVVLGCTHYIYLRPLIEQYYGKAVQIFDGNQGLVKNLKNKLTALDLLCNKKGSVRFITF